MNINNKSRMVYVLCCLKRVGPFTKLKYYYTIDSEKVLWRKGEKYQHVWAEIRTWN